MSDTVKAILPMIVVVAVVVVLDIVLTLPTPSDALIAWTKWIAAVVGIVVSAQVLWAGARWLAKLAT